MAGLDDLVGSFSPGDFSAGESVRLYLNYHAQVYDVKVREGIVLDPQSCKPNDTRPALKVLVTKRGYVEKEDVRMFPVDRLYVSAFCYDRIIRIERIIS